MSVSIWTVGNWHLPPSSPNYRKFFPCFDCQANVSERKSLIFQDIVGIAANFAALFAELVIRNNAAESTMLFTHKKLTRFNLNIPKARPIFPQTKCFVITAMLALDCLTEAP